MLKYQRLVTFVLGKDDTNEWSNAVTTAKCEELWRNSLFFVSTSLLNSRYYISSLMRSYLPFRMLTDVISFSSSSSIVDNKECLGTEAERIT